MGPVVGVSVGSAVVGGTVVGAAECGTPQIGWKRSHISASFAMMSVG